MQNTEDRNRCNDGIEVITIIAVNLNNIVTHCIVTHCIVTHCIMLHCALLQCIYMYIRINFLPSGWSRFLFTVAVQGWNFRERSGRLVTSKSAPVRTGFQIISAHYNLNSISCCTFNKYLFLKENSHVTVWLIKLWKCNFNFRWKLADLPNNIEMLYFDCWILLIVYVSMAGWLYDCLHHWLSDCT